MSDDGFIIIVVSKIYKIYFTKFKNNNKYIYPTSSQETT